MSLKSTTVSTFPYGPTTNTTIDQFDVPTKLQPYFGPPAHGRLETGYTFNSTPPIYLQQPNKFIAQGLDKTFRDLQGMLWFNGIFPVVQMNHQKELYTTIKLVDFSAKASAPGSPTVFTTTQLDSRGGNQQWMGAGVKVPFLFFKEEIGRFLWKMYMDSIPYSLIRSSIFILYQAMVTAPEPFLAYMVKNQSGSKILEACLKRKKFFWNIIYRVKEYSLEKIQEQLNSEERLAGHTRTSFMIAHPRIQTILKFLPENTKNSSVGQYLGNGQGAQNIPQAEMNIIRVGSAVFAIQEECPLSENETWQPLKGIGVTGEHVPFPYAHGVDPYGAHPDLCAIEVLDGDEGVMTKITLVEAWGYAIAQFNALIGGGAPAVSISNIVKLELEKYTVMVDDVETQKKKSIGFLGNLTMYGNTDEKKKAFDYGVKTFHGYVRRKNNNITDSDETVAFDAFKHVNDPEANPGEIKSEMAGDADYCLNWVKNVVLLNSDMKKWTWKSKNKIVLPSKSDLESLPYENPDFLLARALPTASKPKHVSYLHSITGYANTISGGSKQFDSAGLFDLKPMRDDDAPVPLSFSDPSDLDLILTYGLEGTEEIDLIAISSKYLGASRDPEEEEVALEFEEDSTDGWILTPLRWMDGLDSAINGAYVRKASVKNPAAKFMKSLKTFDNNNVSQFQGQRSYLKYLEALYLNFEITMQLEKAVGLNPVIFKRMAEGAIGNGLNILFVKNQMMYEMGNIYRVVPDGGTFVRTEGFTDVKQFEDLNAEMHYFEIRKMQGARVVDDKALSIARNVCCLDILKDGLKPVANLKEHFTSSARTVAEYTAEDFGDVSYFIVPSTQKSFAADIAYTSHNDFNDCSIGRYTNNTYGRCFNSSFDVKAYAESISSEGPKPLEDKHVLMHKTSSLAPHRIPKKVGSGTNMTFIWVDVGGNSVWIEIGEHANRIRKGEDLHLNVKK